jgi:hypothetical protein
MAAASNKFTLERLPQQIGVLRTDGHDQTAAQSDAFEKSRCQHGLPPVENASLRGIKDKYN